MPVAGAGVLYLLPVLLASRWGMWLGIATAVASAAAFNWFHIPPTGKFTIADEQNWVALGAFLVVAVVTSGLADLARSRAEEAERRRREADLTAEMARVLLGSSDLEDSLRVVGQRIARAFDLAGGRADDHLEGQRQPLAGAAHRGRAATAPGRSSSRGPRTPEVIEAIEERVIPSLETLLTAARRAGRARGAGDRDPGAAALERGQDRAAALGLTRPALAADGDHRGRRRPRVADPRRRRPRGARLGDLDRGRAAHPPGRQPPRPLADPVRRDRAADGALHGRGADQRGARLGRRPARGVRRRHRRRPAADPGRRGPARAGAGERDRELAPLRRRTRSRSAPT